jgi:hypothetical protein
LAKKEAGENGRLNGECRLWKPLFFNTLWPF